MKRIFLSLAIITLIVSCSTSKNEEKSEEALADNTDKVEATKAESSLSVLNPNLASKDEMYSLGLLDSDIETIINGRPYLDPLSFLNTLKEVIGEGKFNERKAKIFLPMNLNTTKEQDFKNVPGVGKKMAHEFEEYRPYTSIEQFRREIGKYVSEEEVAKYENYVFVPVNLNTASKTEILAIPGVGEKMLHEFEEYRPYKNIEQFRREIGKYVDDNELARLERYVTL